MKPEAIKSAADKADRLIQSLAAGDAGAGSEQAEFIEDEQQDVEFDLEQAEVEDLPANVRQLPDQTVTLREDIRDLRMQLNSQASVITSQQQQINQYQQLLAGMAAAGQQSPEQPAAQALWSLTEADQFGEDQLELFARVARAVARQEVHAVAGRMQGLEQKVETTAATVTLSADELFQSKLDRLAPTWRELNDDPEVMTWLKAKPALGKAMTAAIDAFDAAGAAEIFNLYVELQGGRQASQGQERRSNLERQVSPGRARNPAPQQRREDRRKVWTHSEITRVYADHLALPPNVRAAKSKEFEKIEAEIAAAQRDGFVDYTK